MSFLIEINLNVKSKDWVKQLDVLLDKNRDCGLKTGEIYSFAEFKSYCGETPYEAVNKWLAESTNNIDGEYAFAVAFSFQQKVMLTKDWSGSRNVFYTIENDKLVVGTNVFQVVSAKNERRFSSVSCAEFLFYEYVAEPKTLFDGVFCVPRGKSVTIDKDGNITVTGSNNLNTSVLDETTIYSGLRESITQAHQKRLGSTNGIYLSGGIDSNVMAIALKRDLGLDKVYSFTFRTLYAEQDESHEAESVSKQLGLKHDCVTVDPNRKVDLFDMIDKSNFPYFGAIAISRIAEKIENLNFHDITMFSGQDSRLHTPFYNIIDRLVLHNFLHFKLGHQMLKIIGNFIKSLFLDGRINRGGVRLSLSGDMVSYVARYLYHYHQSSIKSSAILHATELLIESIQKNIDFTKPSREVFNDIVSLAWDRQYTCDMAYMGGITRAYGNECSMPFYDRDLSNYSASIPMPLALKTTVGRAGHGSAKKRVNKFVLREAYKNDLTKHMIYRDKAVCVSNHLYLNGCMSEYVADFFEKPVLKDTEIGQILGLDFFYQRGLDKNGNWQMSEYEQVVETHNLLFLELIARKYDIKG